MAKRGAAAAGKGGFGRSIAPPRFVLFAVLFFAGALALRQTLSPTWADALAMAFDGAALVFFVTLWPILHDASAEAIRRHAAENDANRGWVLVLTTVVTTVVLAAIAGELEAAGKGSVLAMAKLVVTLMLAWVFANTIYATHYAHLYYAADEKTGKDGEGIDFPGDRAPDYWDFVYFSFTLGMTFQTSDTDITSHRIRRVVTVQALAAFVFNIGVIAFTINVLGGSG